MVSLKVECESETAELLPSECETNPSFRLTSNAVRTSHHNQRNTEPERQTRKGNLNLWWHIAQPYLPSRICYYFDIRIDFTL